MSSRLSQEAIDAFNADGAVLLPGAISPEWLGRVGAAIERDIVDPGPFFHGYAVDEGRFHGNLRLWENDPEFAAYCFDSPLPALAAELMEAEEVRILYDQLFVKEAATAAPTRWHNDQPYWPVRGSQVMSFWLALDDVTLDSGALEFVAGSHKWDRWFQPEPFGPGQTAYTDNVNYEKMIDIEAERQDHRIVSWEMQPGDVIAFHAMTVHGAGSNLRADRRRRGYTVRYIGEHATYQFEDGMAGPLEIDELENGQPYVSDRTPVVWPTA